jgi:hypothetical protein
VAALGASFSLGPARSISRQTKDALEPGRPDRRRRSREEKEGGGVWVIAERLRAVRLVATILPANVELQSLDDRFAPKLQAL